jgi:hypothetical protein
VTYIQFILIIPYNWYSYKLLRWEQIFHRRFRAFRFHFLTNVLKLHNLLVMKTDMLSGQNIYLLPHFMNIEELNIVDGHGREICYGSWVCFSSSSHYPPLPPSLKKLASSQNFMICLLTFVPQIFTGRISKQK